MTADKANALGLTPRARIVDTCIVGSDPVLMLTGPIPATEHLLERNKLTIDDIDLVEINEAFASVVLGWQQATGADMEGQPERWRHRARSPARRHRHHPADEGRARARALRRPAALVTMCCGGGLGTGTILERL